MIKTLFGALGVAAGLIVFASGCLSNQTKASPMLRPEMQNAMTKHPASQALGRLFADPNARAPADFKPTGMMREDYLALIAGNVDFYKQHQNADGAIIDPVQKREIQYSTPSFALAAATLAVHKNRADLLEPAIRAMTFATHALANHTTANNHADFYIPLLIHTRRILKDRVPKETLAKWNADLMSIVPETHYRDANAGANWNIVNLDGETMRRKDGLVATSQATSQPAYVERSLDKQQDRFTKFGMYKDPNMPLAYDAFPRLWMEDMMADGAYDGKHAQQIRDFLALGGLSSLLMISPTGEWACGGRSAHHQWNEAENIVVFEINAVKWHHAGRDDIAGAMKRSAHLAYESMKRWQRPTGELWIVKNRAEPDTRLGYEGYSSHSQYNLLPMAMLCIAFERADNSINERPAPCDIGGYIFDVRETFHKVFANAGGMYIEIDTAADPHYNATGLQRVQRQGVPLSPLSDSTASHRAFGPTTDKTMIAMAPGIEWKVPGKPATSPSTRSSDEWRSLADFVQPVEPKPARGDRVVEKADLDIQSEQRDSVKFNLRYKLAGEMFDVQEEYWVKPDEVTGSWKLVGDSLPTQTRLSIPALVNDGAKDLEVKSGIGTLESHREGGVLTWQILSPAHRVELKLDGPSVPNHNGYARAVVGDLPDNTRSVDWRITLEQERR